MTTRLGYRPRHADHNPRPKCDCAGVPGDAGRHLRGCAIIIERRERLHLTTMARPHMTCPTAMEQS